MERKIKPLSNFTIDRKLKTLFGHRTFRGVFDQDSLPKISQKKGHEYPWSIVVNTLKDTSDTVGHWVVILFNKQGKGFYFDSFGRKPLFKHWITFLEHYSKRKRWTYSHYKVQKANTASCGYLCIDYIVKKLKYPLENNDKIVLSLNGEKAFEKFK